MWAELLEVTLEFHPNTSVSSSQGLMFVVTSRRKNRTKGKFTPGCSSHHASGMIVSICLSRNEEQLLTCFLGAGGLFGFSLDCDGVSSTYDAQALQKMCPPGVRPPTGVIRYGRRFRRISERTERRGGI